MQNIYTIEALKTALNNDTITQAATVTLAMKTSLYHNADSPEYENALELIVNHYEKSAFSKFKKVLNTIQAEGKEKEFLELDNIPVFHIYNQIMEGKKEKPKNETRAAMSDIDKLKNQAIDSGLDSNEAEKIAAMAKAAIKNGFDSSMFTQPMQQAIAAQQNKTMVDNVLNWLNNQATLEDCALIQLAINERMAQATAQIQQAA